MNKISFALIVGLLFVLTGNASAQVNRKDKGMDPEKLMTLKDITILGVKLTMPMGEIIAELESRGLHLDCKWTECTAKGPEYTIGIKHKVRASGAHPKHEKINMAATPLAIRYFQLTGEPANCEVVHRAIENYCPAGVTEFPCRQDRQGQVVAELWSRAGNSSDGYVYTATIAARRDLRGQCSIRMKRAKKASRGR